MTGHRINPSCERRLLAIFALACLSRCITALLQWPSVRRLPCHPEPSQSWSFTIICRTVQGNGLLPSSLSHFLRQCPLGSNKSLLLSRDVIARSLLNLASQPSLNGPKQSFSLNWDGELTTPMLFLYWPSHTQNIVAHILRTKQNSFAYHRGRQKVV